MKKGMNFGLSKDMDQLLDFKSLKSMIDEKATKENASQSTDGLMSSADKTKLDKLENYNHPSTHEASMIVEDSTHRFVTDAEKEKWNSNTGGGDLGAIEEKLSQKADKNHTHDQYIENSGDVTFKGAIKATKLTIDNNQSLVASKSNSGFVDLIYLDPQNKINIGYEFAADSIVNCQMKHRGNVTMENASFIFSKTDDKTARLEYFQSPSRLELYWSASNEGQDWDWANKISFSSEGSISAKRIFLEGRRISHDGNTGGLAAFTSDGSNYSNFTCGGLYVGPYGGATARIISKGGTEVEFIVSDGSRYSTVTCGSLNLGPHQGNTVKISAGSQAPSYAETGDIWIQV